MGAKFAKWFLFSVLSGVTALAVSLILMWVRGQQADMVTLLGKGQLFPVCASLAGGAIGNALSIRRDSATLSICLGGAGFIMWALVVGIILELNGATTMLPDRLVLVSMVTFGITVAVGGIAATMS
jgi:hypothetical protein